MKVVLLAGGRGTLMARGAPKDWSPPAFYAMGSGSVGLQIGAKVSEVVFIIKTEKGLQAILDHKFKFGAEAGVSLAVVGIAVEGASTAAGGAAQPVARRPGFASMASTSTTCEIPSMVISPSGTGVRWRGPTPRSAR